MIEEEDGAALAHVIKVLYPFDRKRSKENLGLWFLVEKRKATVAKLCAAHGIYLGHLRTVAEKLKIIRNKTHFHLDEKCVRHPRKVWKEVGLTKKELDDALDGALRLLLLLHVEICGTDYAMPWYDGSDATKITVHAYKHRLLSEGEPPSPSLAALFQ